MADSSTISTRLISTTQYTTPSTGTTVTANDTGNNTVIINPSGTLLALTLALNGSPVDGDKINIAASQIVTTFTISGGTIIGTLTTLAVATFASYLYNASASKWFRVG